MGNKNRTVKHFDVDTIGMLAKDSMLLQKKGNVVNEFNGKKYELFSDSHGQMIVQSSLTGKKFVLTWGDALRLADYRGVDVLGPGERPAGSIIVPRIN